MKRVVLVVRRADKEFLASRRINTTYVEHVLNIILDTIRPSKSRKQHKVYLDLTDDEYSVYPFTNRLSITRKVIRSGNRGRLDFLNDLFHEFGHYIQYKIDRVIFTLFAVDHESTSYTKYYNNVTERQARKYGSIAKEALCLYMRLEKLHAEFKTPLNSLSETKKAKTSNKGAACRELKRARKKL